MGRLIDADVLVKIVDKHTTDDNTLDNDITCILEEVSTAYDVEAKVAKLEELAKLAEERWKTETTPHALQEYKCWVKAIEIVRGKE